MNPSSALLLLLALCSCGTGEAPEAQLEPSLESEAEPVDLNVAWAAQVKSTLEPMIESQLGLRNRVEANRKDSPIRIVFLDLPPRKVPREFPNGEIKEILNPDGAPSRIKLLVRDVIEASRLEIEGFEMYNGKSNPEAPTPFQ